MEQFNETLASLTYQSRLLGQQQSFAPRRLDGWPKFVSAHCVANLMSEDIEAYKNDQGDPACRAEQVLTEVRTACASVITTIDQLCLTVNEVPSPEQNLQLGRFSHNTLSTNAQPD
jgi:hypothetical protein